MLGWRAAFALLTVVVPLSVGASGGATAAKTSADSAGQPPLIVPSGRELDSDPAQRQAAPMPGQSGDTKPPVCTAAQVLKKTVEGAITILACRSSNASCGPYQSGQTPECVLAGGKL